MKYLAYIVLVGIGVVVGRQTTRAQAVLVAAGSEITAESCGIIGNGAIDPDETVTLAFALRNEGSVDTTNVVATLQATGGVVNPGASRNYGVLLAGGSAVTNLFSFSATGSCGGMLTASLSLDDNGLDLGTVTYEFLLGALVETTQTLTNSAAIILADGDSADPYPSTITISNLPGVIRKVTAILHDFSHEWPEDIDMILVSPDGDAVSLLGADGGDASVTNITLTFDDDADSTVGAVLSTGTWLPSGTAEEMNEPAPAPPYGGTMSHFNGGTPNGIWSLYARDYEPPGTGTIASGWSLSVTARDVECCRGDQPPIFDALDHQTVVENSNLIFSVTATDPVDGDAITLTASNLPAGAAFPATNGMGTFIWNSASPTGIYPVTFCAEDKDGMVATDITVRVESALYENTNCAVLISEYVEGTSSNKALEIYNPSLTPVDMEADQYVLQIYANGSSSASGTISLTGTIPAQSVFVLANSDADAAVLAVADMTSGSLSFNGNNAVVLYCGGVSGTILDSIGQLGVDPGTEWGTGIVSTAEHTLRRMSMVEKGDADPSDAYDPALEWEGFAQNTFDGLGRHTSDCSGPPEPSPPVLHSIGDRFVIVSNTLRFEVAATPTDGDAVTLAATNLPEGAVFDSTNELGTFLWANASPTGTYSVTFAASDIDGTDEDTIDIVVGVSNAPSFVYLETFDDIGMWSGTASNIYGAKSFDNDTTNPVADEFYSNLAVVETNDAVATNLAWCLKDDPAVYLRYGVKTNLTRLRVQMARRDNNPVMDFEVRYSTDYGTNYTTIDATNGDWFAADMTYQEWDSGRIDLQPVDGRSIWIEIYKFSGECLLIDDFEVEYGVADEPGTPPVLQPIGNQAAFLGEAVSIPIQATLTDGDPVTLGVSNLPPGAEFSPTNESGTFLWFNASPTGLYSMTFYAEDKDGRDEETIDITLYPLPFVSSFSASNGVSVAATFTSVSGQVYQMEYSLDLLPNSVFWIPLNTVTGTGDSITLSDTNNGSVVKRYYRLVAP